MTGLGAAKRGPVCELHGVGKRYGLFGAWVISEVTVALYPGQLIQVTGPNGCGKSTLLRVIAGATRPSAGTLVRTSPCAGYAPDQLPDGLGLPAGKYLHALAAARGLPRAAARERVAELTQGFGLASALHRRATTLSKGTAHKVALCQAILEPSPLLVLDEPWSGLDRDAKAYLEETVRSLRSAGTCIVIADHGEGPSTLRADRELAIEQGRLQPGAPA